MRPLPFLLFFVVILYGQNDLEIKNALALSDSDSIYILENSPEESALNRVKKNVKHLVSIEDFDNSIEILKWAQQIFIAKDSSFNSTYFSELINILSRDDEKKIKKLLPGEINTNNGEYWPTPYYEGNEKVLYFTRHHTRSRLQQEDIFISSFNRQTNTWSKAKLVNNINHNKLNDAVFSLTQDGSELFMFRSYLNNPDKSDLYFSNYNDNRWSEAEKLPSIINGKNDYEGGAFITKDGSALMFSSDKPGGIGSHKERKGKDWGNQDIYVSERYGKNDWGAPINLGSIINTNGAELTPYLADDGVTLYFSSNGHTGLGGTDVFKATRKNLNSWTEWEKPINMGKYVNTPNNDEGFKISPNENLAYFASQNNSTKSLDIYTQELEPVDKTIIVVQVLDEDDKPVETVVKVTDPVTGEDVTKKKTDDEGKAILHVPNNKVDMQNDTSTPGTPGATPSTPGNQTDKINSSKEGVNVSKELNIALDDPLLPPFERKIQINQDKIQKLPPSLNTQNSKRVQHSDTYTEVWFETLIREKMEMKISDPSTITMIPNSTKLIWPLKSTDSSQFHYDAVSMYMDHDSEIGAVKDYYCGEQSYDLNNGYNHRGTDIMLWPFSWNMMDASFVEVVASAGGTIIDKLDGQFDRNCNINTTSGEANTIVIMHHDGSTAIYAHLKRGSLTTKTIGDRVIQGERLGNVGSSGASTGPHLHFEVLDSDDNIVDPFGGKCGGKSWWENQKPYYDTALNHALTHYDYPQMPDCPESEILNDSQYFFQGDSIHFSTFYRDVLPKMKSKHKIYSPTGKLMNEYELNFDSNYTVFPNIFSYKLASDAETGKWTYSVNLNGMDYKRPFIVHDGPRPTSETTKPDKFVKFTVPNKDQRIPGKYFCSSDFNVQFEFNSAELGQKGKETIKKFVNYLMNNNFSSVRVTGFADSQGNADYNLQLSRKRASSVGEIMQQMGILNVFTNGKGEENLIKDEWGRELKDKSRRVEFCWRK